MAIAVIAIRRARVTATRTATVPVRFVTLLYLMGVSLVGHGHDRGAAQRNATEVSLRYPSVSYLHRDGVRHFDKIAVHDQDVGGAVAGIPGHRVTQATQIEAHRSGGDDLVVDIHGRRGRRTGISSILGAVHRAPARRLAGQGGALLVT